MPSVADPRQKQTHLAATAPCFDGAHAARPAHSERGTKLAYRRSGDETIRMSFKQLTPNNWDRPDDTSKIFGRLSPLVGLVPMNGNDWARAFLAVELPESVPRDIRDLFAVARGTLLYGWFFYPLYQLGDDQLHRVADTAMAVRYEQLGGARNKRGYPPAMKQRLAWLIEREAIPAEMEPRWEAISNLRNAASHPDFQPLNAPGQALASLRVVAESVTSLFSSTPRSLAL